jgi:squalene synthase HpnC/squalene synthase HpnD
MPTDVELEIARTLPPAGCSPADAQRYTHWLATHHYENFHVVSWFLPSRLRQHFYSVYAYCRWSDDLADEVGNAARSLELLDWWERELELCYEGRPSHPVFVALAPTVVELDIPIQPFRDLLRAFRQDQTTPRYASWDDVIDYCRYSANPVGRLVLYLCGYRDEHRQRLSDATCTALQLANFWQDVSRDLDKGRIYIPGDLLAQHGLSEDEITSRKFSANYRSLMQDLIARTRALFAQGAPLADQVDADLRVDLRLFSAGGVAILDAIEASGYNTLQHRPAIGTLTRARLLTRAAAERLCAPLLRERADATNPAAPRNSAARGAADDETQPAVAVSYEDCRNVARAAASNFYYAFYALPRPKRDALCALYAFMRLVDDVSDEGGSAPDTVAAKRAGLARWRILLDRAYAGDTAEHAILPAFADTVRRYKIPQRYFHDLISGAEMDLTESRYATFERLREYCYRVAGTVGLTCLHVFGFSDPHAPELAERLGIAFQLTNILRDVGPDLAIGRVYLPAEDLDRFGCTEAELAAGVVTPSVRELLRWEAQRAWTFYEEGARLIPKIDRDSRATLWALTRIYSGLLARIESRDFDVFSSRVRLTSAEKARILLRARLGWWSHSDVLEERDRDRRRSGGAFLGRRAG